MSSAPVVHVLRYREPPYVSAQGALASRGIPLRSWIVDGHDALDRLPPRGLYWAKLDGAPAGVGREATVQAIAWIESMGNRVVNGGSVMPLRSSHFARLTALEFAGFETPRSVISATPEQLRRAARSFAAPFLVRADSGEWVHRLDSHGELEYLCGDRHSLGRGPWLVQEIVAGGTTGVARLGFIGGRLATVDRARPARWMRDQPVFESRSRRLPDQRALRAISSPYEQFVAQHGIDIAAIEVGETRSGRLVTLDLDLDPSCTGPQTAASIAAADRISQFFAELIERRHETAALAS